MKIALITTGKLPQPAIRGGIETLIDFIIEENEYYDNELTCYSIKPENEVLNKMRHVKFIYLRKFKLYDKIIGKINVIAKRLGFIFPNSFSLQVLKDIKNKEFDFCLIENNINMLCNVKRITCDNIAYHIHYDDFNDKLEHFTKDIYVKNFTECKKVIAISEYIKNITERTLSINNIQIIKNIIDYDRFQALDKNEIIKIKNKYSISQDDFVVFYSGRIVKEKGVLELIEAFNLICEKNTNLKLLIVGDYKNESQSSYCEEVQRKAELNEKIVLTGYIDNDKLKNYVAIANLTVIPTLYVEEAAGLVCLESMCLKKPIIITDSGALREYTNGLAIEIPRNNNFIINLSNEILNLSMNSTKLRQIGESLFNSLTIHNKDLYYKKLVLENLQGNSNTNA